MQTPTYRIARQEHQIEVYRDGTSTPILTQQARPDHRPFLHPIMAPDGVGELTEYSPGHHPHQTGLYWGFTRVNGTATDPAILKEWFYKPDKPAEIQSQIGRDFFHHPGGDYWRRVGAEVRQATGTQVAWQTVYDMLDAAGAPILTETQSWSLEARDGRLVLDLEWRGQAQVDIAVNEFSYGGMFLRMPYRKENGGRALNSDGASGQEAEGQPARWVGVEMPIPGRDQRSEPLCSIVIMDHPANPGHPTPWRVDGQLGIGPCRAIAGTWQIPEGTSAVFRHRLLIACGALDRAGIERTWEQFAQA